MKTANIPRALAACLLILLAASSIQAAAQNAQPVVHAVLFYSPTCPHCQYVIQDVLPPLMTSYGPQLQMIGFDVTHPQGKAMFESAMDRFGLQRPGVPLLVIDNITLTDAQEIADRFPGLIESSVKLGGVDWPEIPGLQQMLIAAAQAATAEAAGAAPSAASTAISPPGNLQPSVPAWQQRFARDVLANSLAVALLVLMLFALVWAFVRFARAAGPALLHPGLTRLIPILCILGLAVAGYLAFVEGTHTKAVCGPVGDCNTVQQSPYARLFGFLSIGAFGLLGYGLIVCAWALARIGRGRLAHISAIALFVLALLGTVVSIYLTFLEPFVIGATCIWCLTSATLMTALMLLTAGPAGLAFNRILPNPDSDAEPSPARAASRAPKARPTRRRAPRKS